MRLNCRGMFYCLALGCLSAWGCGGPTAPKETQHVEVSGKVLFKGNPLPGGSVIFVAEKGGFSSTGRIEPDGSYKVNAPIGNVKVAVETEHLKTQQAPSSAEIEMRKATGAQQQAPGKYVPIPPKYADAANSGLTYVVGEGPQTYDIKME